ncbi:MAG: SDR family NAD(P)-dependent oxidoreductase [Comamonadaceae bacterium]|nr:SDR family NAD(P)-dependent oxidoreductase [Comamonadaceae bacterium]
MTTHEPARQDAVHHRRAPRHRPGDRAARRAPTAPTSCHRRQDDRAEPEAAGHDLHSAAEEIEAAGGQCAAAAGRHPRRGRRSSRPRGRRRERFGGIDILVNNASAISLTPTEATPMKRFDLMFGVNVRGTYLCTQACLPYLKAAPSAGRNPHVLNAVAAAEHAARAGSRRTSPTRWPSTA